MTATENDGCQNQRKFPLVSGISNTAIRQTAKMAAMKIESGIGICAGPPLAAPYSIL